jgi:glyceraldehyde 3-phosphate dehydrogenase
MKENNLLQIGNQLVQVYKEPNTDALCWGKDNIDVVLECSGHFTSHDQAMKHIQCGAKKVIVSAPCDKADITVVVGVNHHQLSKKHQIISNASCTTNCLAPIAMVLENNFGIEMGYMTTIHAYTGDQRLIDTFHKDLRRARAAAISMIPSTTGAAKAVGLVLPSLKAKLDGSAIRVPVSNVSVIDFKFMSNNILTVDLINECLIKAASSDPLRGVLEIAEPNLVSCDFNHTTASAHLDTQQTQVCQQKMGRILAWYDNEWGFSNRMIDLVNHIDCYIGWD